MDGFANAYVLINTKIRDVDEVRERLNKIPSVVFSHCLIGPNAIICYIETNGTQALRRCLNEEVRSLLDAGIIASTETLFVLMKQGVGYSKEMNNPPAGAAWVFANSSTGDVETAVDTLRKIPGVANVHAILGRYDIAMYLCLDNWHELMDVLDTKIRKQDCITSTDTRMVFMRRVKRTQ